MARLRRTHPSGTALNPHKVLYPETGYTCAQVVAYYLGVAPVLLPHLKNRPVAFRRYPAGATGESFWEKDAPGYTPAWVKTYPVPRRRPGEPPIRYVIVNDRRTLAWAAGIANLEIHPFLHQVPAIDTPTSVVFDLDPGEDADLLACARVAGLLRHTLGRLGLESFAKVSGSKGVQVYVPLNTPVSYASTQPFARAVAELLEREHGTQIVAEMSKHVRTGKVFIDWSQNAEHKTTVSVYSLRAMRERPYVSAPVQWAELEAALHEKDARKLIFEPDAVLRRTKTIGDLSAPMLALRQALPAEFQAMTPARRTPRPPIVATNPPAAPRRSGQGGRRRFVMRTSGKGGYDLALEMSDTVQSWALPEGVPSKVGDSRLAIATDGRPLRSLTIEGARAGRDVWDVGTYELIEGLYAAGQLRIFLSGTKLRGEWRLERRRGKADGKWVLTRLAQGVPVSDEEFEVLPAATFDFVEPMQCLLVSHLPEGPDWQYEVKLDGYRALATKAPGRVRLLSRRGKNLSDRFPSIVNALHALPHSTMLDGEVVALDEQGHLSFRLLQQTDTPVSQLVYYAFDCLVFEGRSVRGLPLRDRRKMLESVLVNVPDPIRLSARFDASAADLVAAARRLGLEGVVGKCLDSLYEAGRRSGAWVKQRISPGQELVIGGYLPGPHRFDALLVGYYEGERLLFVGKIRNGFVPTTRAQVFARFSGLETAGCPFANLPEPKNARRGLALTAEAMRQCRWLKPTLVAQVAFTEWTDKGHLRHARFVGLRDDKDPREVTRESAS